MTTGQYRAWREGLVGGSPAVETTIGGMSARDALTLASELHGVRWSSGREAKAQLVKTTHDWLFSRERVEGIMAL